MANAHRIFTGRGRTTILPDPDPRVYVHDGPNHVFVETPVLLSRVGTDATDPAAIPQYDPRTRVQNLGIPSDRKWSQEDQDKVDLQAKRKAMKELINSWMDRLQLISVITTFFAAIEAQLLGIVTPDDKNDVSSIAEAANVGLASALVVHVFAAIMSFIAAFFLVRFRLHEATHDEIKAERGESPKPSEYAGLQVIFTTDPHLEQVGPLSRGAPPIHLLKNCHTLCMLASMVGFALAMFGTMCYIWDQLPLSASIFSTACVGLCCVASIGAIFIA
ncbi:hypothetical protein EW026_g4475 [Hermanssonia centrifuga]|uniref:Uncharacterized protein n=1 Tax=Hermanssonia centrifuga TaxID=98765 RepID=A0A4S4KH03_9APHY|nr:hypothetical protein EW026_g4475 [Hermanssonia centrifuga]